MTNETIAKTLTETMLALEDALVRLDMVGQTLHALNIGFVEGGSVFKDDAWSVPIDAMCQGVEACISLVDKAWEMIKAEKL